VGATPATAATQIAIPVPARGRCRNGGSVPRPIAQLSIENGGAAGAPLVIDTAGFTSFAAHI
jgi:hypothetical protein